jgi:hypothetical protein
MMYMFYICCLPYDGSIEYGYSRFSILTHTHVHAYYINIFVAIFVYVYINLNMYFPTKYDIYKINIYMIILKYT